MNTKTLLIAMLAGALALCPVAAAQAAAPVVAETLLADGTTNTWTQADLVDALGLLNRRYRRDIETEAGRRAWHGRETAQALVKMLPYKVRVSRYSHDFCGIMDDPLPYKEEDVHHGWLNGDIDFATDANYFTILFEDEENSEQYGYQVNIGVITCELSKIAALEGSYEVLIELAE